MKVAIQPITVLPVHLLTEWQVLEFEEGGSTATRFFGLSRPGVLVLSPPIEQFDPDCECGLDVAGEVWLLFPGHHARQSRTCCELSHDVTASFVEAMLVDASMNEKEK